MSCTILCNFILFHYVPLYYIVSSFFIFYLLFSSFEYSPLHLGILRPHIHLIVPVICKLISQLQDIGTQTVPWQAKAVATLRRICTSARGSVVEQSLIVVSRTVHCLTRTVTIAHEGTHIYADISCFFPLFFMLLLSFSTALFFLLPSRPVLFLPISFLIPLCRFALRFCFSSVAHL